MSHLINLNLKQQNIKIDNIGFTYFRKINIKQKKNIRKCDTYKIIHNKIKDKDNGIL